MNNCPVGGNCLQRAFRAFVWNALPALAQYVAAPLLRLIGRSWQLTISGSPHQKAAHQRGAVIYASWHGNISSFIYPLRDRGFVALVSPVWEGEMIARVLKGFGYELVRGSSGHQSTEGLRASIRVLKQGHSMLSVVDGPEGPAKEVKAGVIAMAQFTGATILPTLSVGTPSWAWPYWDRHELPLPGAKVLYRYGEPMTIPREATRDELESYRLELENRLIALDEQMRSELPGARAPFKPSERRKR